MIQEFIEALEHAAQLGKDVAQLERDTITGEAEALVKLIEKVKPVMPHMDKRIVTASYHSGHQFHQWEHDYLPERGVVLVDDFDIKFTDRDTRGVYVGSILVLTRTGRLLVLKRRGSWSKWQGEESSWYVEEEKEIGPAQAVKRYGLGTIIKGLAAALEEAAQKNEEKRATLKERLELLGQIQNLL